MSSLPNADVALERLIDSAGDGVFVLDRDRRFVVFNPACERITGLSSREMLGQACDCAAAMQCRDPHGRSLGGMLCPGLAVFRGEQGEARQRMRIVTGSGEPRWVETTYAPVRDASGEIEMVIGVMRDISASRDREEEWCATTESLRNEVESLRAQSRQRYGFAGMVSRSPAMQVVMERIHAAAHNSGPVLICGPAGSGRETAARIIHFNGLQKDGPFVVMSCAATRRDLLEGELVGYARGSFAGASQDFPGLYKAADGGTLFIDDIEMLPESAQLRLARAMQDRCVRPLGTVEQISASVRVIAAVSRDPHELLGGRTLREELYYRLSVMIIELPPLRDRKEDLPLLVEHVLEQINHQSSRPIREVEPEVWRLLDHHDWPGNVRELRHVIESAAAASPDARLHAGDVAAVMRCGRGGPASAPEPRRLDDMMAEIERKAILEALARANGQRSLAAKLINISRSRLYRRMDALGIEPHDIDG